jgi:hypothetical protein
MTKTCSFTRIRPMKALIFCLLAAGIILAAGGCASPNVNPASAQLNTGYVDFYCDNADNLYWDITDNKTNKKVFYEFDPIKEPILRVALKPGQYQLRINFLNHVISTPATTEVDVHNGMITPVTVTLVEEGTETVRTTDTHTGGTYYGRYGRNTRIVTTESTSYDIMAEPRPSLPYQQKAQMPYTHRPDQ